MWQSVFSKIMNDGDILTVAVEAEEEGKRVVLQTMTGEISLPVEELEDLRDALEAAMIQEPEIRCEAVGVEIQKIEHSLTVLREMRNRALASGTPRALATADDLARRIEWRERRLVLLRDPQGGANL